MTLLHFRYAETIIDIDGSGPLAPFPVRCEFFPDGRNITYVGKDIFIHATLNWIHNVFFRLKTLCTHISGSNLLYLNELPLSWVIMQNLSLCTLRILHFRYLLQCKKFCTLPFRSFLVHRRKDKSHLTDKITEFLAILASERNFFNLKSQVCFLCAI